jgi:hypothetical protein
MPKRIGIQRKNRWRLPASELESLTKAARAVVTAHAMRDDDRASDEDVSDAIAKLKRCLPRHRREARADHSTA